MRKINLLKFCPNSTINGLTHPPYGQPSIACQAGSFRLLKVKHQQGSKEGNVHEHDDSGEIELTAIPQTPGYYRQCYIRTSDKNYCARKFSKAKKRKPNPGASKRRQ